MGSVLQDLDDVDANSFLVGRILRRGIWILLPLDYGVRQQLTRRSAENVKHVVHQAMVAERDPSGSPAFE